MKSGLTLALPKGRLLDPAIELLRELGVSAVDPITFAGVPVILLVVTAVASFLPARRASGIDPVTALREE